jgi:deoxyribodipyrimidine photo-lyase
MSEPSPLSPTVVLVRDDLRLGDNPALAAAIGTGQPVLCVFVHDEVSPGLRRLGGAARWWLHASLSALSEGLAARGGRLDILCGGLLEQVLALVKASGANAVFWNRRYVAAARSIDAKLKAHLVDNGVRVESFNAHLLYEPWQVRPKDAEYFRVFTPFWRAARASGDPAEPLPAPPRVPASPYPLLGPPRVRLEDLRLRSTLAWSAGLAAAWQPGEVAARQRLQAFLTGSLGTYDRERDRPDLAKTSTLSPYLRFGEISARQVFAGVKTAARAGASPGKACDKFLSELGWREFSYHLLFHTPDLATRNVQRRFDAFEWAAPRPDHLRAWQLGRTGYPLVDAGMRELWTTGTMHNRVRMVVASFLVKHLLVDWRIGEGWFWDTLCDADPASNPASWQWVAGCGADAAPYFRIFNPVLQGEKFDPTGAYVRRHVPELADLPSLWIHRPWLAPAGVLESAGIRLNETYPGPIVDHAEARRLALAAFDRLRLPASLTVPAVA